VDAPRYDLLGVRIAAVDYDHVVEAVVAAALERRAFAVTALAVHGVTSGARDAVHRYRLNALDLAVPDGQPVRWAARWLYGIRLRDRVYGPTLMLRICQRAASEHLPVFLFGGTADQVAALAANLQRRFPSLRIAGAEPSQFRRLAPEEDDALIARIAASGAALTFVGLGCPRQEVWAFEARARLPMPIVAVGAAFAFHAGTLPQAPPALQDRGLEWLFRLVHEPRRLWRRYLLLNPFYLWLVLLQRIGLHRFDAGDAPGPDDRLRYG
jgi:exopolysaccharide biosynthesis WecB/TagA/CpsF family protein